MILVVQGPGATPQNAREISRLASACSPEPIGEAAFRLRDASNRAAVGEWCAARAIDCAWMPGELRLADLRLVAIDMDSTLITIECIDELGEAAGRRAEIAAITEAAMRGELDFGQSLRRRVALLAGVDESALERVYEQKLRLSPGAERLVAGCKAAGIRLLLVSGGFSFFTERLRSRLGLDYTLSNKLEIERGKLTGRLHGKMVNARAKAERLREVARALGARREQTLAIGDGANDLPLMAEAGISVAFRGKPVARDFADFALDHAGLDGVLNLFL
ncbi:MAG TPA: phosphoserine phosphatase SerB [Burkholderiales bacterium]|nr:phosphoserine phosphatase SerB [Burkholderiales bacterium]